MALIPPSFIDAVVAIGEPQAAGTRWIASGFLYGRYEGSAGAGQSYYRTYLVTNRHVFDGKATVTVRFNPTGTERALEFVVQLQDDASRTRWFAHPRAEVDVAILPIIFDALKQQSLAVDFFRSNLSAIARAQMSVLGVSEGDGVFVLGFPMALVGAERNTVIVRRGSVARVRDTLAGSVDTFLVDALIFPGNSGGPVVSCPEVVAIHGTKSLASAHLIGIVTGYLPYRDVAVSTQTGNTRIVFEDNSGLAAVHPVDHIEETIDAHVKTLDPAVARPPAPTPLPDSQDPTEEGDASVNASA